MTDNSGQRLYVTEGRNYVVKEAVMEGGERREGRDSRRDVPC